MDLESSEKEKLVKPHEQDLLLISSSNNSSRVLKRISKSIPYHLKQETENLLRKKLEKPDNRKDAITKLTWYCLPQVDNIVSKFQNLGVPSDDLVGEALLTTQETINDWAINPAPLRIRQQMLLNLRRSMEKMIARHYGIPPYHYRLIPAYHEAKEKLGETSLLNNLDDIIELINHQNPQLIPKPHTDMQMSSADARKKIVGIFKHLNKIHSISNNEDKVSKKSFNIEALYESETEKKELLKAINRIIKTLPEKHQKVLSARYGLSDGVKKTYKEIAKEHHVTPESIRTLEYRTLYKIKKYLNN